jgi:cytochrome b6-f complex iron-sulfur subunit
MSGADQPTAKTRESGEEKLPHEDLADPPRRRFLARAGELGMGAGLLVSYGTFGAIAAKFIYPAKPAPTAWMFVRELAAFSEGTSMVFEAPTGAPVVIARKGTSGTEADFAALSSTCPHLGCRVHWEAQHGRFFCPCHNGTFDSEGKATGGPPFDAKQALPRYPLKVEAGLLYIEVPTEKLG